jgi:hypothetical protein
MIVISCKAKDALFPRWKAMGSSACGHDGPALAPDPGAMCCMTEIQLQAILDRKGDPDGELDVDMTTNKQGEKLVKYYTKTWVTPR